jgi:hypothetical protein
MQTIKCQSVKELKTFNPCKEAMAFIKSCGSFRKAWNTCNNTSWMLWFLLNVEYCDKQLFAVLAKQFADHVKHLNNFHSRNVANAAAAAAAANDANAAAAAVAYAVAAAAYADAVAADAYADAVAVAAAVAAADAYADAVAAERKWQCDLIRSMFKL